MLKSISMLSIALAFSSTAFAKTADNQLSKEEQKAGWQLLFNGQDMSHWRNFKSDTLSSKWTIDDGAMLLTQGGGDILTKKSYVNFDLKLDWKISEVGNSGIFVLADELGKYIYSHAPEIQIIDNERHSDTKIDSHLSGSIYDLLTAPTSAHKPAMQWNTVRIIMLNNHLQVWQNGVSTASIVVGSSTWNTLVKNSKFATWSNFATVKQGRIGLQDHGDKVWFKNIKIKEL
ncbi:MAG: 3-keto-disaccharide hydrolase [Pseudoalteromonas prydzensis]|uniref:3-keto-disaccharide hydrolase n=1 Tax=Pseudoalteromonas prydzensis TaxID=182141 RepID=UPI003F9C661C